jgi:hypothetical protein
VKTAARPGTAVAAFVLFLTVFLGIEALSLLGIILLERRGVPYDPISPDSLPPLAEQALARYLRGEATYVIPDSGLGWTIRPGAVSAAGYHATADGLREPSPAGALVAAYGDSFTHGDDVPDSAAWVSLLGARNFGVPGYGLDQAYLRYGATRPHVKQVLIGYMSENLNRTVSVFRPFYSPRAPEPFAKPRFRLVADTLVLDPNPMRTRADYEDLLAHPGDWLPRLGRDDLFYHQHPRRSAWDRLATVRLVKLALAQPARLASPLEGDRYRVGSEGFRVTVAVFDAFVREVRRDGAEPVIVMLPHLTDLQIGPTYAPLRDTLAARGYSVLDLWEALAPCRPEPIRCFGKRYHYNERANRMIAEYLERRLSR